MTEEILDGVHFILDQMDIDYAYAVDLLFYGYFTHEN